jgi:hypothetical protein
METEDLVILALVAVAAWWLFRNRAATALAPAQADRIAGSL